MRGKRNTEKRLREIKVRFTDSEFEALMEETGRSGLSREDFCRRILSGAKVVSAHPEDPSEAIALLREAEAAVIGACGRDRMELGAEAAEELLMTLHRAEKKIAASCG